MGQVEGWEVLEVDVSCSAPGLNQRRFSVAFYTAGNGKFSTMEEGQLVGTTYNMYIWHIYCPETNGRQFRSIPSLVSSYLKHEPQVCFAHLGKQLIP